MSRTASPWISGRVLALPTLSARQHADIVVAGRDEWARDLSPAENLGTLRYPSLGDEMRIRRSQRRSWGPTQRFIAGLDVRGGWAPHLHGSNLLRTFDQLEKETSPRATRAPRVSVGLSGEVPWCMRAPVTPSTSPARRSTRLGSLRPIRCSRRCTSTAPPGNACRTTTPDPRDSNQLPVTAAWWGMFAGGTS
jgi:hypothetical protein